jgi:hypothetical protein
VRVEIERAYVEEVTGKSPTGATDAMKERDLRSS